MPCTEGAAGAVRPSQIAVLDLHRWVRLAAQLPHGFENLRQAAAVRRMIVAQPAAIGVERQFADPRDQIAVADKAAALALLAEAEILELHQYRDRKAVIDRGVFDVARLDAGFGEGEGARPRPTGQAQVQLAAHLMLWRFAGADEFDERALQALRDFRG